MDIVHADADFHEIGFVDDLIQFDACIETKNDGENDFQLDIDAETWTADPIQIGHYLYIEGTEFGGMVESIKHITKNNLVRLSGVTWRGMLNRVIVSPPSGQAYKVITNTDANTAVNTLLDNALGVLFMTDSEMAGVNVSGQYRYETLLYSINKLLDSVNYRLEITLDVDDSYSTIPCRVILSAKPQTDWSETIEFSQDYDAEITSTASKFAFNHVIALGSGELTERTVRELWMLDDGTITDSSLTPGVPTGLNLRTTTYDFPSAESTDELIKGARERLESYKIADEITIDLNGTDVNIPLGDIVGIKDYITRLSATQHISKKILRLAAGIEQIQHYVS